MPREIAAVEGIDALLIGTSDLTAEMGISGQIAHASVAEAYEIVGAACNAARQGARHGRRLRQGNREPLHQGRRAAGPLGLGPQFHSGRREGEGGGVARRGVSDATSASARRGLAERHQAALRLVPQHEPHAAEAFQQRQPADCASSGWSRSTRGSR